MTYYTIWTNVFTGLDRIHSRVLMELAEVFAKPLSVICHHSSLTREVLVDWRLVNVMLTNKKDRKEDTGSYRLVSIALLPGKVKDQIATFHGMHRTTK